MNLKSCFSLNKKYQYLLKNYLYFILAFEKEQINHKKVSLFLWKVATSISKVLTLGKQEGIGIKWLFLNRIASDFCAKKFKSKIWTFQKQHWKNNIQCILIHSTKLTFIELFISIIIISTKLLKPHWLKESTINRCLYSICQKNIKYRLEETMRKHFYQI